MEKYNLILDNTNCDFDIMWYLFRIQKYRPALLNNRIQKIAFYFMFPYSIWSISKNKDYFSSYENVIKDTNKLNDNGFDIYFEFENTNIKENHFNDKYSNMVLDVVKDMPIKAVVYNKDLAEYIKKNYPNVKLVQSAFKNNINTEPPFEMNIIDYNQYKNNKSVIEDKKAYILSVNSFCKNTYFCTDYLSSSKINYEMNKTNICINRLKTFQEMAKNELFVSLPVMNIICGEGIKNFLVRCNCDSVFERIETYLYYTIKPEYINSVRLEMLQMFDKKEL